jgi:hypothetical protein
VTLQPRRILTRTKMLDFLVSLAPAPVSQARSLYLPPGLPRAEVENSLKEAPEQTKIFPELAELAHNSKTGSVIFWSPEQTHLVLPPFPIAEKRLTHDLFTEPLDSLLKGNYLIALVLVRLGAYAIGICQGENLVSSKVGTGLVHGRHKKGGSSQQRFARHRDKQTEYFLSRVCGHAREQLQPQASALDYIVYGGARTTIQLLQKQCPFLGQLDKHALPPLLDIPEPRQAVLETAISRVWSSTVTAWRED